MESNDAPKQELEVDWNEVIELEEDSSPASGSLSLYGGGLCLFNGGGCAN